MGLLDKMKTILFDDIEEEDEERRDRKKNTVVSEASMKRESRSGFVDHSVTEDTITEIKLPREEIRREKMEEPVQQTVPKEDKPFGFTLDLDNYEPNRDTRTREKVEEVQSNIRRSAYANINREYQAKEVTPYNKYAIEKKPEVKYQGKDYKQLISSPLRKEKKPFAVTPVISPVYGIIDEDYIKENGAKLKEEKKEEKEEIFGPVSYIEDILPKKSLVKEPEIEEEVQVKEIVREIATPNYDDYEEIKTSGIENQYIGNNIEDAFEPTSEYESVNYAEPVEELVTETEKKENEALADTIETDLFNLIDSMYKDEEEE